MSGTYVFLKASPLSRSMYKHFIEINNIPNPVSIDDLHCTLIYSPGRFVDIGTTSYKQGRYGELVDFDIWKADDGNNVLVGKLNSTEIINRHHELKEIHGFDHHFDEYRPHISLSYNIPNGFDLEPLYETMHFIKLYMFHWENCEELI